MLRKLSTNHYDLSRKKCSLLRKKVIFITEKIFFFRKKVEIKPIKMKTKNDSGQAGMTEI